MGAIVAWTLNVETNPLNLLSPNINVDEVESLENILDAKHLLRLKILVEYQWIF